MDAVHRDLAPVREERGVRDPRGAAYKFTSDTLLRIVWCPIIEGGSRRQIIVRIDDRNVLRRFVRIFNGPRIDFTAFGTLRNPIRPETWKHVNGWLAQAAVAGEQIEGERLRLDTTAVETTLPWPTDSSLLGDTYRPWARLLVQVREIDPARGGVRRLLVQKVKKRQRQMGRKASKRVGSREALKRRYRKLFGRVENSLRGSNEIAEVLAQTIAQHRYTPIEEATMEFCRKALDPYRGRGERVLDPARRRSLDEEAVPNEEKIFRLFEPHTERLKRGKAARPIEFGHRIQIQPVEGQFITDYAVFERRPVEHPLVEPARERHKALFGKYPDPIAGDKGYDEHLEQIERLGAMVDVGAMGKKGQRTEEQTRRETDPAFRHAQCFRAGVDGSISFLKRVRGRFRWYHKGWAHYVATAGATGLAHNRFILARCGRHRSVKLQRHARRRLSVPGARVTHPRQAGSRWKPSNTAEPGGSDASFLA